MATKVPMTDHPALLHTVLDAMDVRGLAEFYRDLLGLHYRPGDEPPAEGPDDADWLVLTDEAGTRKLAFQLVDDLPPTNWPGPPGIPMQMHLDCTVTDRAALERHKDRALALGASLRLDRTDDPDEALYVLADPAGHPFCFFVG